jgi:hypothetical protein
MRMFGILVGVSDPFDPVEFGASTALDEPVRALASRANNTATVSNDAGQGAEKRRAGDSARPIAEPHRGA